MNALNIERNERRELWRMLDRLDPRRRVAFVRWCCRQASWGVVETRVTTHTGTTSECYHDIMLLAFQHGLDLELVACELTNRVRRRR